MIRERAWSDDSPTNITSFVGVIEMPNLLRIKRITDSTHAYMLLSGMRGDASDSNEPSIDLTRTDHFTRSK